VQASFATSPAERGYFVKKPTFRQLARLKAPQTSKAPHASHSDRARRIGQKASPRKKARATKSQDEARIIVAYE
jgi:hypothetical protein